MGYAYICGELDGWPTIAEMAELLREFGLNVVVGRYSIRIPPTGISFQEYGGDLGEPQVEGDADSVEEMLKEAQLISGALTKKNFRHRFEIYDGDNRLAGYIHHRWPLGKSSDDTPAIH